MLMTVSHILHIMQASVHNITKHIGVITVQQTSTLLIPKITVLIFNILTDRWPYTYVTYISYNQILDNKLPEQTVPQPNRYYRVFSKQSFFVA